MHSLFNGWLRSGIVLECLAIVAKPGEWLDVRSKELREVGNEMASLSCK